MYKMNLFLKIILLVILLLITALCSNHVLLWILFLLLTCVHFIKNMKKITILDILLCILLIFLDNIYVKIIFKVLFIITSIVTFLLLLTKNEIIFIKWILGFENKKTLRKRFRDEQYNMLIKENKKLVSKYYDGKESIDDKVASDLEIKEMQARMRFLGYRTNYNNLVETWCGYDTLVFVAALLLFILLLIVGR